MATLDTTVRKYGAPPFRVAVLHGGPGAPGYMAPVARELANDTGVLEPLQTRDSLEGQIDELAHQLREHANCPVTLIGSSWGAVLALFLAARQSEMVKAIILIGSAVFDAQSSTLVESRRLERLDAAKRRKYESIRRELKTATEEETARLMREWGGIMFDTDVYDPLTRNLEGLAVQYEVHKKVWADFVRRRDQPGYLRGEFSQIAAPAVVIHGAFDPHPIEGIRPFLESCVRQIRFEILPECGHYPWIERQAKERFYRIVRQELAARTECD